MKQTENKVLQKNLEESRDEIISMACKWLPHTVTSVKRTLNERFDAFENKLNSELKTNKEEK